MCGPPSVWAAGCSGHAMGLGQAVGMLHERMEALISEQGQPSPKDMQHREVEEALSLGWSDFPLEVKTEPRIPPKRPPLLCPQKPGYQTPGTTGPSEPGLQSQVWLLPHVHASSDGELTTWGCRLGGSAWLWAPARMAGKLSLERNLSGATGLGVKLSRGGTWPVPPPRSGRDAGISLGPVVIAGVRKARRGSILQLRKLWRHGLETPGGGRASLPTLRPPTGHLAKFLSRGAPSEVDAEGACGPVAQPRPTHSHCLDS